MVPALLASRISARQAPALFGASARVEPPLITASSAKALISEFPPIVLTNCQRALETADDDDERALTTNQSFASMKAVVVVARPPLASRKQARPGTYCSTID